MPRQITKIPVQGGSGRIPTGAIQFEGDWPGFFLRGDSASSHLSFIRTLEEKLRNHPDPVVVACMVHLSGIADIIERDVVLRDRNDA